MTQYVYDAQGQLAAEYKSCNVASDCVDNSQPHGTQYLEADKLGSTRLITDANGAVTGCQDYLPFGDVTPANGPRTAACYAQGVGSVTQLFAGEIRDGETGLDYLEA